MGRTIGSKGKASRDRGVTKIDISWHYEDVIERAEDMNRPRIPTKKEAREILYNIKENHDATIGINWDVIDFYIDEYFKTN